MTPLEQLDADILLVEDAIRKTISGGVSSFSVAGGTSYENLPLKDLRDMLGEYRQQKYRLLYSSDGCTVRTFPSYRSNTIGQ